MKELVFQVEFLSDIVLPATSNTEGNITQLDFIPGSNFLGMVASKYGDFEKSFDVFHSGKVRFGDANILHNSKQTYKMPLSYFHKKLEEKTIYNHHFLEKKNFEPEDKGGLGQLKQLRNGYITKEKEVVHIDYSYSQKSAYDKENRRSKDSSMYGYKAINAQTSWQFTLQYEEISEKDLELLIRTLIGTKRLGKSKSAQYGLVEIKQNGTNENIQDTTLKSEILLYANSRLALVDENGNPTYDLRYLCDGLDDANIVYEKTQIRTSTFTPYNSKRATKDYERVCINKGSVIVVKDLKPEQLEQIKNGVGAYLSEGFGDILVNPDFLNTKDFTFPHAKSENEQKQDERLKISQIFKNTTVQFLANRHNTTIDTLEIANEVAAFVSKNKKAIFSNIKPSQWGNIRSIASSNEDNFMESINTYISNGTRKWEDKQIHSLISAVNNHTINKQKFVKLLSMQMPKVKEQKND